MSLLHLPAGLCIFTLSCIGTGSARLLGSAAYLGAHCCFGP